MTKRTDPGGTFAWSMAGTIDGLNKAADSIAYSMVKQAPINLRRASLIGPSIGM